MVVRVMLSMPPEFLERIDRRAEAEHRSRSELVREALRLYLREVDAPEENRRER